MTIVTAAPARASAPARSARVGASDAGDAVGGIVPLVFRGGVPGAVHVSGDAPKEVLPLVQASMEEGIREALAAKALDSSMRLVDGDDMSVRLARVAYAPGAEKLRDLARRKIASAYDDYFSLDLDAARHALDDATGALERSPQTPDDLAILSDIKLLDGIIALNTDPRDADEAFDLVLRLTPDRTLDPQKFPPYAVAALHRAKERFDLLPTTQVNVETDPPDALTSIDGTFRGRTPLTLDRIPTGEHFYRVEKAQMKPIFGRLEFRGGVVEPLSLHLEAARAGDLAAAVADAVAQTPSAPGAVLSRLFVAERVVIAEVAPDGPRHFAVSMWWARPDGRNSYPLRRSISAEPWDLSRSIVKLTREAVAALPSDSGEPPVDGNALARDLGLLGAGAVTGQLKPPPPAWYQRKTVIGGAVGGLFLGLLLVGGYYASQPGKVNYDSTVPGSQ